MDFSTICAKRRLATGTLDAIQRALRNSVLTQDDIFRIRNMMLDKGYDEEIADYCVQWLLENRFLNDECYAGAIVRHYAAKGYGPGRIRMELSRRGIDHELWDSAFEELPEDTDKIDKFISSRLTDPSDRAQVQKVSAALYRRGHSWEDIRRALRRFSADCEE